LLFDGPSCRIIAAMMDDRDAEEATTSENEHADASITIKLTPSQVDRVIRDATGTGNMSLLLSGALGIKETLAHDPKLLRNSKISTSLLRGLQVFSSLPSDESYIGVSELARELNESPSTTHRYLSTLQVLGLVEQHPRTRKYRPAR
jgi:predicted AAA+ superfamily ATPase